MTDKVFEIAGSEDLAYGSDPPRFRRRFGGCGAFSYFAQLGFCQISTLDLSLGYLTPGQANIKFPLL